MLESGREPGPSLLKLFEIVEKEAPKRGPCDVMRAARLAKGLSFKQLAKMTRYNAGVLEAVEAGQGRASERMIEAIAKALDLDKASLMDGSDHLLVQEPTHGTYGATPPVDVEDGVGRPRYVPHLSMAQAGTMAGTDFTDGAYEYEGAIAFAPKDSKAFAVTIVGDSMAPNFTEGDVALVYPSFPPRSDDLVICRLKDGDVMFKIYTTRDSGRRVVLSSFNPAYQPRDCPREDFDWIYPVAAVTKTFRR